jgi:putative membrane protein
MFPAGKEHVMFTSQHRMTIGLAFSMLLGIVAIVSAGQKSLGKADAAFLQTAAQRQESEIQLSQLAAERSEREQVKHFAQRMIQDHTKANQEISKLAAALGLALSEAKNDAPHRTKEKLFSLSGRAFERAYLKHEMAEHQKNVSEFAAKSKALKNIQVREWASATFPF